MSELYDELMSVAREGLGTVVPTLARHLTELDDRVRAVEGRAQDDVSGDVATLKSQLSQLSSQVAGILSAITVPQDTRPQLPGPPAPLAPATPQG
jgi:hypothetical protein